MSVTMRPLPRVLTPVNPYRDNVQGKANQPIAASPPWTAFAAAPSAVSTGSALG